MSAKRNLLKGRYTSIEGFNDDQMGAVRYLDPSYGTLYFDSEGVHRANSGFRCVGNNRWVSGAWEFTTYGVVEAPEVLGYVVVSSKGKPTVLHRTQSIAETEALRLAQGNTGVEFTVFPVYCGNAVSKAHTPKPVAKLERL